MKVQNWLRFMVAAMGLGISLPAAAQMPTPAGAPGVGGKGPVAAPVAVGACDTCCPTQCGPSDCGGCGGCDSCCGRGYRRGLLVPGGYRQAADVADGYAAPSQGYGGQGNAGDTYAGGATTPAQEAGVAGGAAPPSALPMIAGDSGFVGGTLVFGDTRLSHPAFGGSRLNLVENGSPLPQDRVFVVYRHFDSATSQAFADGQGNIIESFGDIDRYTFGLEKRFFDNLMSIEFRLPFNSQYSGDAEYDLANPTTGIGSDSFALGDIGLTFKGILVETSRFALTTGIGLRLPTAQSFSASLVNNDGGLNNYRVDVEVDNDWLSLVPFLGMAYVPNDRFFTQTMFQIDVPTGANRVSVGATGMVNGVPADPSLNGSDQMSWQSLARMNVQFGYWFYRNPGATVNGMAGLLEFHYTTSMTDSDEVFGEIDGIPYDLYNAGNRIDMVNLSSGVSILAGKTEITPVYVVPLSSGEDKAFEWEFDLMINRRF